MFIIRGLMNHLVIVFVGVLIVVGIVNKDKIETELIQMGYLEAASSDMASVPSTEGPSVAVTETEASAEESHAAASAPTPSAPIATAMPTHLTANAQVGVATTPARVPVQQAGQPYGNAPYYAQQQMQMQQRMQQQQQRMQQQMQARQVQTAEITLADDVKTQWSAARAAYWQRDLDKAEKLYKALLEGSEEAAIAGELGNIYFTHRRFQDAANMFYEAGLRHFKSDIPEQANMVMGLLIQLDPPKAQDLRTKLMELHQSKSEASTQTPEPTEK